MKIRLVGAELFHADGQTDRHDEAERFFSKFCESIQNAQIAKCTRHLLRMQGTRYRKLVHE